MSIARLRALTQVICPVCHEEQSDSRNEYRPTKGIYLVSCIRPSTVSAVLLLIGSTALFNLLKYIRIMSIIK